MDELLVQDPNQVGPLQHDLGHVRTGLQVAPPLELEQIALGADHRPLVEPLQQPRCLALIAHKPPPRITANARCLYSNSTISRTAVLRAMNMTAIDHRSAMG